jgi:hypothetical protein
MAASLSQSTARSTLYRTARGRVISVVLAAGVFLQGALPPSLFAQAAHPPKTAKGPRALGLLELAPNGKAHLIPITILIDGKYYDASAYKAAPVPMALWSDTVYEAVLTGVSQGLFTVTGALQRKDANEATEWMAEGTWQSASALKAKMKKKPAPSVPRGLNEDEGPPVLRRSSNDKPKSAEPPAEPATPSQTASASSGSPGATTPAPATTSSSPATPSPQTQTQEDKPADNQPPEDKDRPTLKRGKSGAISAEQSQNAPVPSAKTPAHPPTAAPTSPPALSGSPSGTQPETPTASQIQLIPAISDSHSPELIPYAFNMQPGEEQEFRKKMLAIAADEVRARAGQPASTSGKTSQPAHTSSQRAKTTTVQPIFEDVQLRVFDLGNVNEAELVLTAKARMPQSPHQKQPANPGPQGKDLQYMITIVARQDVNDDLHKALANITDTQHLDAIPRLELIDAVDVDGDGRGELLFREVSEAGTAFVIYRVIGDRLYPLFQGTPG